MKKEIEIKNKDTYFLKNNSEVKVICTTMPHYKIYITNINGKLKISQNSSIKKS